MTMPRHGMDAPTRRIQIPLAAQNAAFISALLSLLGLMVFFSMGTLEAATKPVLTSSEVGLENEAVRILFDAQTGELVSLRNMVRADEYLKDRAKDGGPFRIFSDFRGDFDVSTKDERYLAAVDPATISGLAIDPSKCQLLSHSFRRTATGLALDMTYGDPTGHWHVDLEVWLPDEGGASEWDLKITNVSPVVTVLMTAFPDISGFRLGQDASSNLQTALREGGIVIPAWSGGGGVYGNSGMQSMQWHALFDRKMDEYLGLIVQDPDIRNKWFRFPRPRIQVLYFPAETLAPGQSWKAPRTELMVGDGDWKPVARAYSTWFGSTFRMVEPPAWEKGLDGLLGVWFGKQGGLRPKGNVRLVHYLDSFAQLPEIYRERPVDMHEYAFHTQGSALQNIHTDGDNVLRSDLGGAAALKEGIAAIHRMGYRFTFYVEGYIVHQTSELAKSGKAQRWSVMHKDGSITGGYTEEGFYHMCPGVVEWQDHLADVVSRLVRETGADGVRLDSLGYYFLSCYNPAHHHSTPFGYNQWIQQLLDKVSRGVRAVNPECVLTTEAAVDFYSQWFHGALLPTYPRDIPAIRIALPGYRLFVYAEGSPVFASLAGLLGGTYGYPDFIQRRTADENWRSMRQGVGSTLVWGEVADEDPKASLPDVTCRLFYAPDYSVVVGARAPSAENYPLRFPGTAGLSSQREPFTVRVQGVKRPVEGAYLYDIERATVAPLKARKEGEDWVLPIESTNWFMVVLRKPEGPAIGSFSAVRTLHAGESAELNLVLLTPSKGKAKVQATLSSRGLTFAPGNSPDLLVTLPGKATLVVPAGTPPGRYPVELKGEKVLGMKRFVVVE